jgi:hypothetical protein
MPMTRLSSLTVAKTLIIGAFLIAGTILYLGHSHTALAGGGTYSFVDAYEGFNDTWVTPCADYTEPPFNCGPGTEGLSYTYGRCVGAGWDVWSRTCTYTPPPACTATPDSSCAANTCTTSTCTATNADCTTSLIGGTKDCSVSCTASNSCGMSNSGTLTGGVCSASAPSESLCPPPSCANGASNYPTCTFPPNTCANGASDYPTCTPPTCGNGASNYPTCTFPTCANGASDYPTCTPPVGCTADTTCGGTRVNTCTTATCSDSCGNTYTGTKSTGSCVVAPGACTSPTITIKAAPSRVKSGQTTTLTITGTGLNSSCTLTGTGSGATVNQTLTPASCTLSPNPTTVVTPAITTQSTFTVTCAGDSKTTNVIVNLNPVFTPF